jgi:putative ABC transport system substrate-binding protein
VRRRNFISLLVGAAAAWPIAARPQQPAVPVIGHLFAGYADATTPATFRRALAETGYVEGQSVAIESRYAEGQYHKFLELAEDLVRRKVSVIVALPNTNAARAAKAATATIPILFMVGDDLAKLGLVASLNRPGDGAAGESDARPGPKAAVGQPRCLRRIEVEGNAGADPSPATPTGLVRLHKPSRRGSHNETVGR